MDDQILSLPQVSQMTGLAKQSLYALRSRGEGPPSFLIQGRIRYRKSAVEAWIAEQEAAGQDRLTQIQARA